MFEQAAALTFDAEHPDQPSASNDAPDAILDILARRGVQATVFVQGAWAQAQPTIARRIGGDGHVIGLHSHYHVPYPLLTDEGVRCDLETGWEAVTQRAGVDPAPWFRLPFGIGLHDPRLAGLVADMGFAHVHWTVDPKDWHPSRSPAEVAAAVLDGVRRRPQTAIVLLHLWSAATAAALERLLDDLGHDGVRLATVPDVWDEAG